MIFSAIRERIDSLAISEKLFVLWAGVLVAAFSLAVATETYYIALVPVALLVFFWAVTNFRGPFLVLMACIPLSTEVVLPNGFGTDLPTEPIIVGLMGVALFVFAYRNRELAGDLLLHPFTLLLGIHIFWIYFSTAISENFFVSFKFSLAKTWYVAVFYFLAYYLVKDEAGFIRILRWVFWPMLFTVVVILVRHGMTGFSFAEVHKVLHPFQRNHVNYAATITLFLPYIWLMHRFHSGSRGQRILFVVVGVIFLAAIYFSYTRAAYVALLLAAGAYFVFRLRLIRLFLVVGLAVTIIGAGYLFSGNRFLELAPNYDTTIAHREFGSLLDATAKGEDISTMERLYRWVAGIEMSRARPFSGYGPGNFVNFYKAFSINSFRTYVSNNEEKSGIHSYFLMTLVEQGVPGLLIFLALSIFLFIKGEQIYHETCSPLRKAIVMAVLLSLVVIYAFLIINDMIETDKVGSFFFISIAILARVDMLNRRDLRRESQSEIESGKAK